MLWVMAGASQEVENARQADDVRAAARDLRRARLTGVRGRRMRAAVPLWRTRLRVERARAARPLRREVSQPFNSAQARS